MSQIKKLKVDLHVHTNHSRDSRARPADVVKHALKLGFDAIAITDHNTATGALETEALAKETPLHVIPGQEIQTKDGEVIVLNLRKTLPIGMPSVSTISLARELGGFVIAPHPFDPMRRGLGKTLSTCLEHIDAVEVFNPRSIFQRFNDKAFEFAKANNLPMVVGSDSHFIEELGQTYMIIDSQKSTAGILEAIRQRKADLITNKQPFPSKIKRGFVKIKTYF